MRALGALVALAACGRGHDRAPGTPVIVEIPSPSVVGKKIGFGDDFLRDLRARPEVLAVALAEPLAMPASGHATVDGHDLRFELGGFTDGIDPAYVTGDLAAAFQDWDAAAAPARACGAGADPCGDGGASYCDEVDHACRRRVPVLLAPFVIDRYNESFAKDHGLPPIPDAAARAARGDVRFDILLGDSIASPSSAPAAPPRRVGAVVVGVSPAARTVAITVPVGYVRRWMKAFGQHAPPADRLSVRVRDRADLDGFEAWLHDRGFAIDGALLIMSKQL